MASPETFGDEQSTSWQALDARISRLEQHLGLAPLDLFTLQSPAADPDPAFRPHEADEQSSELEASIGEFGLAWVGSIVFFLGVVFLITYTSSLGHRVDIDHYWLFAPPRVYSLSRIFGRLERRICPAYW